MRPNAEVEASLTETVISSPTLAISGPSIVTFGRVSAAAPVASAVAGGAWLFTGAAFASGAAAAFASVAAAPAASGACGGVGGGRAAAAMRAGTARGPLGTGAAGAFDTAVPAPNDTPPGPAAAPLANGPERVCDSLPY